MLKSSSVSIAKNRLRALVVSDRVQCTPSVYDHTWNLQKMIFK